VGAQEVGVIRARRAGRAGVVADGAALPMRRLPVRVKGGRARSHAWERGCDRPSSASRQQSAPEHRRRQAGPAPAAPAPRSARELDAGGASAEADTRRRRARRVPRPPPRAREAPRAEPHGGSPPRPSSDDGARGSSRRARRTRGEGVLQCRRRPRDKARGPRRGAPIRDQQLVAASRAWTRSGRSARALRSGLGRARRDVTPVRTTPSRRTSRACPITDPRPRGDAGESDSESTP